MPPSLPTPATSLYLLYVRIMRLSIAPIPHVDYAQQNTTSLSHRPVGTNIIIKICATYFTIYSTYMAQNIQIMPVRPHWRAGGSRSRFGRRSLLPVALGEKRAFPLSERGMAPANEEYRRPDEVDQTSRSGGEKSQPGGQTRRSVPMRARTFRADARADDCAVSCVGSSCTSTRQGFPRAEGVPGCPTGGQLRRPGTAVSHVQWNIKS